LGETGKDQSVPANVNTNWLSSNQKSITSFTFAMPKRKRNNATSDPNPRPRKKQKRDELRENRGTTSGRQDLRTNNLAGFTNRVRGSVHWLTVTSEDHTQSEAFNRTGLNATTKLTALLDRYEQYYVHSLELEFVPTKGFNQDGSITCCFDYDAMDTDHPTAANIMAQYGAKQMPVRSGFTLKVPNVMVGNTTFKGPLYVSPLGELRLTTFGRLFWLVSGTGLTAGDEVGYWVLHYDISLISPNADGTGYVGVTKGDQNLTVATANRATKMVSTDEAPSDVHAKLTMADVLNCATTLTGTLMDMTGNAGLSNGNDHALAKGQRIYYKPASSLWNEVAGTKTFLNETSTVGQLATDPLFSPNSLLKWNGDVGDIIKLTDVIQWAAGL
jgi:hypothetical protein